MNIEEETESVSAKIDDAITLSINKEEEFEEEKESRKDLDALSDLSLSEDEKKDEWLVLDDINDDANGGKTENAAEKEKTKTASMSAEDDSCTKCDVPHKPGDRCSFLLKSSSNKPRPARPPARQQARVRTLPPELYNNPDRAAPGHRSRRSDSPPHRVAPPRRRIAPPPPSPPGYEDRRDKRARYDNYESDRYEPSRSEQELASSRYQVMRILIIFWSYPQSSSRDTTPWRARLAATPRFTPAACPRTPAWWRGPATPRARCRCRSRPCRRQQLRPATHGP